MPADFKYTFEIEKAEERDGHRYLYGEASGPGIDSQDHEVEVEAVVDMAKQINDRFITSEPLPYKDAHAKDGVWMDLGVLSKAWVTDQSTLGVEVMLDDAGTNAAADRLYYQIKERKKKFGMSIKGHVPPGAFARIEKAGKSILSFKKIILDEISNTTRPVWTPSLGTVIAKAIEDSEGEDEMPETVTNGDEAVVEQTVNNDTENVDVENAGAKHSKTTRDRFLALYREMTELMVAEGILDGENENPVEKSESDDTVAQSDTSQDSQTPEVNQNADSANDTTTPAVTADTVTVPVQTDREKELERQIAELTKRIEAAEAQARKPDLVTSGNIAPQVVEPEVLLSKLPPEQRLFKAFEMAGAAKANLTNRS